MVGEAGEATVTITLCHEFGTPVRLDRDVLYGVPDAGDHGEADRRHQALVRQRQQ
jgi:hypothetical protein